MIIYGKCDDVSILYTKEQKSKKDDRTFFSVCLWFVGLNESGEIPCNEEVYKTASQIAGNLDVKASFKTAYNTQWKNFSLVSCDINTDKKK